jgi:hypothetical protein
VLSRTRDDGLIGGHLVIIVGIPFRRLARKAEVNLQAATQAPMLRRMKNLFKPVPVYVAGHIAHKHGNMGRRPGGSLPDQAEFRYKYPELDLSVRRNVGNVMEQEMP